MPDADPLFEPDELEAQPFCIECVMTMRAVPLGAHDIHYFCRGCGMSYTLNDSEFKGHLPPEFRHCVGFQETKHVQ